MLRFLSIRNLAVIDRLELELEPGLSVLTGETGAGKSILVGAVGLLAGARASGDLVRTGEDTAAIEAIFEGDDGTERIVRREISAQAGRSRAFVDGALATSAALRELAAPLVDLHGQHEQQVLLDPASHLDLLDEFAGLNDARAPVAEAFAAWCRLKAERDAVLMGEREKAARAEFLSFQLQEIDRAAPKPGEDEELAAARQVLGNADKLQRLCAEAYTALYEGDDAALPTLGTVWRRLGELAAIDERFRPYLEQRDGIKAQLEDAAYFLRQYADNIDASPARLQEVEDRLAVLERLKRKHGPTLDDVLLKGAALRQELHDLEHAAERAAGLDAAVAGAAASYERVATALSCRRREAADRFSRTLESSLAELAMARTRCDVRFAPEAGEASWSARGTDAVEFFISPNPGEELRPLARIASGGELSRIMLALKTLASIDAPGKTLIFDEVDTGIGGGVADVVGGRLRHLAERVQVLCITHLPQIAAYGASHYSISKAVRAGRTVTSVARISGAERELELARMIAGAEPSPSVLQGAREMLAARTAMAVGNGAKANQRRKAKAKAWPESI
ncbi:MAG TPA: DNA repair protein RecN [Vicinamibacterales bacterium]|nr:DNA repair protein RecN [Vicinamibacterales bacterium]